MLMERTGEAKAKGKKGMFLILSEKARKKKQTIPFILKKTYFFQVQQEEVPFFCSLNLKK